jgi:uncharacterized protein YbcI
MKPHSGIEAAMCDGSRRREQEYMGRGPKDIRARLVEDRLLPCLQAVLTAAEPNLVTTLLAEKGQDLSKRVRTRFVEPARPIKEALVQETSGVRVLSLHHETSTLTGNEVVLWPTASFC